MFNPLQFETLFPVFSFGLFWWVRFFMLFVSFKIFCLYKYIFCLCPLWMAVLVGSVL